MSPPAIFQTVPEGVFSEAQRPLLVEHLPSSPLILAMVTVVQPATGRIMSMAYSVMVWLVEPGEQAHQEEAMQRTTTGRANAPGAASGVNELPPSLVWCMESRRAGRRPRGPSARYLTRCERRSRCR